ncbi:hypothetical protein BVC80_7913g3 [Macleaya cordata]|uniref:Transposase-associated domain-containing protein n=1 Tax=Macleaya cordata TaxID=56857 RepID=A0A200PN06_MACCD|nr:hypothetical protein BVC80_7913g3 [Macleaya cordata]
MLWIGSCVYVETAKIEQVFVHIDVVEEHLWKDGMDKTYTRWVHHGEDFEVLFDYDDDDVDDDVVENGSGNEGQQFDGLQKMLEDLRTTTQIEPANAVETEEFNSCPNERDGNQDTWLDKLFVGGSNMRMLLLYL